MFNMLIATRNNDLTLSIINNTINFDDVRICQITHNSIQTISALNNKDIDIAILDLNISNKEIISILNRIKLCKKEKYLNSILILSNNFNNIEPLLQNEFVIDCISNRLDKYEILDKLNKIIDNKNKLKKRKLIIKELQYIQYNLEYKGTLYLLDSIIYIYNNPKLNINNLQKDVYPLIANTYNKSINNIRCNIRRATDCMYNDCESKRLQTYFGILDDEKPSVKEVIYTIISKL